MKRFQKILMLIFLLPVLPIIGIPVEGGSAESEDEKDTRGADTAADTKEDGSAEQEKTFTQAEVDALIDRRLARERRKAQQSTQTKTEEKSDNPGQTEALNSALKRVAASEAKAALAIAGVKPERVERAVRLIDLDSVMDDGELDDDKLQKEITALLKDFPELKQTTAEQGKGFKMGADTGKNEDKKAVASQISAIFGNTKK